jgi:hypothetical protein
LTGLRLRPGQTIVKDVSTITGDAAAAVHVTTSGAEGAVTAALVSESPRPPLEFSTSSSSPPLSHAAVVPVFDDTSVDIAFSTVEPGGGAVLVQPYDANGDPVGDGERVPVRRSTTQIWSGGLPDHAAYMVVTVLDGDAVQASATYHGKLGQSAIPVVAGTWTITRPAVHPAA